MMIVYRYNEQLVPPAPMMHVQVLRPDGSGQILQPGLVDTGADRTVIPSKVVTDLNLIQADVREFRGFAGETVQRPTFVVLLGIHDRTPIPTEVVADPGERFVILGRDVLNQCRLVLDGPQRRLELE